MDRAELRVEADLVSYLVSLEQSVEAYQEFNQVSNQVFV